MTREQQKALVLNLIETGTILENMKRLDLGDLTAEQAAADFDSLIEFGWSHRQPQGECGFLHWQEIIQRYIQRNNL